MKCKEKSLVKLHPEVKEISFRHKLIIQQTYNNSILGTLGIDYFSLMIIDSSKTLSIFSNCPALEFNMIYHDLWLYDGIFEQKNHEDGAFMFWDELYSSNLKNTLVREKQQKFGFNFGFFIMKKIDNIFVIYSFATKDQKNRDAYRKSQDILTNIGNYFYSKLEDVHQNYAFQADNSTLPQKAYPKLKLIVDNTKR